MREEPVMCVKIPPPVVDKVVGEVEIQNEIIRKEMTACSTKKAAKRKRTTRVRCLREDISSISTFERTHAYSHGRETV